MVRKTLHGHLQKSYGIQAEKAGQPLFDIIISRVDQGASSLMDGP